MNLADQPPRGHRHEEPSPEVWDRMASVAWATRDAAYLIGNTRVGAAVLTGNGTIFSGCNVEHRFRCHDIHAEVNAIGTMVADGHRDLVAVLVVAERERFTPCGSCMDWIFQFGGAECIVGFQNSRNERILVLRARELMPHYPV
jgi:cytidine deaminase